MNVLIIKISSMGDIIHTLPAVTDATNTIPNITFDWIVEKTFSEIPQWHPSINQVIPIQLRSFKKEWYNFSFWKNYYNSIHQLRKKKYDVIIDAQGLLKTSIFISSFIHNGTKHGLDYTSATEPFSCFFYQKTHKIRQTQHAVNRLRQLFSNSLQYPFPSYSGKYNIQHIFQSVPQQHKELPFFIFFYNTTQHNKCWPEPYWHTIAKYIYNTGYYIKLPFWTKEQNLWAQRFKNNFSNNTILLKKPTLQEIAKEIIQSTAIISVDTGLSHLSAALNRTNLTLYGPTDPNLIGTYGLNQMILRSKTKKMKHLYPKYVWDKFIKHFTHILK